ncbi:unnamed protein product [Paramecium primaurelia]|uniref:Uncharacterized protein n=1 Tax=Paramecium primaurelia TaxID=5886 RepID=A0A8S1KZ70_PARPR|nr:unnamed protein product [Paramecium primaurelia]
MVSKYNQEQNYKSLANLNSNFRTSELKILRKNPQQNICTKKTSYISITQITHFSYNGDFNKSIKIKNSTRTSSSEFDPRSTLCQKQQECKGHFKEITIISIQ